MSLLTTRCSSIVVLQLRAKLAAREFGGVDVDVDHAGADGGDDLCESRQVSVVSLSKVRCMRPGRRRADIEVVSAHRDAYAC